MTPRRRLTWTRLFMDTSAYYALADARDANHGTAKQVRDGLIGERARLFTTNFVLAETHALVLSRLGREIALRVIDGIERSTTTVVRASARDEARARSILRQYDDKDFSLTDAMSFAVMERLRITRAFSFDAHFAQYGLDVLGL
jgi:uncharacterized protein